MIELSWDTLVTKGLEGAPATAVILLVLWLVRASWRLAKRIINAIVRRPENFHGAAGREQSSVRREPTFLPVVAESESANGNLEALTATVEALKVRVTALELKQGLPSSSRSGPRAPERGAAHQGETVVSMDRPSSSRRRIDVG